MNNSKFSKKEGFTIIETLVAVAILMISIAGPLTIAQKGLTAAVYARDQSVATFLAQDVVEYIKNVRDRDGFDTLLNSPYDTCSENSQCAIETTADNSIPNKTNLILYHDGIHGYYTSTTGTKSQFTRSFYLEEQNQNEVRIVVTVSWKNGTISNVVTIENEIFNK